MLQLAETLELKLGYSDDSVMNTLIIERRPSPLDLYTNVSFLQPFKGKIYTITGGLLTVD